MEFNYQKSSEGLRVKYSLVIPDENASENQALDGEEQFRKELEDAYEEIERLTNHADGYDYAIAVSCGIVAGIIDSVFIGKWDFYKAKRDSNIKVNKIIVEFAKKDPRYIPWCKCGTNNSSRWKPRDPDRLESAVEFLEKHYKLPGDNDYQQAMENGKEKFLQFAKKHGYEGDNLNDAIKYMNKNHPKKGGWTLSNITMGTHHLDDLCHHPTLIGLISSIIVQFTGTSRYQGSKGGAITSAVEVLDVNEYGEFVSSAKWGKVFAGIINWFFSVAKNWQGHLLSDISGTAIAVKKRTAGAGIPGTFMSTLKELSMLPGIRNTDFPEKLRKAYQNGIGVGGGKLDLKFLNPLFEGAVSRMDVRTENAVKHELQRQAIPVIINELMVRGVFFVRRFIQQVNEKRSLSEIDWKLVIPINNRTIVRMVTISSGVFSLTDIADALIRAVVTSKGDPIDFSKQFILRVNFVGIGRFVLAVGADVYMGLLKTRMEIAVASGEVANTALGTKCMIKETEDINNKTATILKALEDQTDEIKKLTI